MQTMGLLGGVAMFVGWVLSDLLEEQMIGTARRERQRAAKRAARTTAPTKASRSLPRAVARPRSVVASRSAP